MSPLVDNVGGLNRRLLLKLFQTGLFELAERGALAELHQPAQVGGLEQDEGEEVGAGNLARAEPASEEAERAGEVGLELKGEPAQVHRRPADVELYRPEPAALLLGERLDQAV